MKTSDIDLEATAKLNQSTAREFANRANAQLSTGPNTEEGKAKSSRNAIVHGLTGRTVLLPSEDADAYQNHLMRFFTDHVPETDRERELVQCLADTQWRLNRIPGLEFAIYAAGRIQYANLFKEADPLTRPHMIDNHTLTVHARQLNNLSIQESRLRRNYKSDLAELAQLQAERREREKAETAKEGAAPAITELRDDRKELVAVATARGDADGFVFSNEMLNAFDAVLNTNTNGSGR